MSGSGRSWVVNGRFKGGWITRSLGDPGAGVHALQMELACRFYLDEPIGAVGLENWPMPWDPGFAAPARARLTEILETAIGWARG